jgi:hypothetical protein
MYSLKTLVIVGLGLLFAPVILKLAREILVTLRARLASALPAMAGHMGSAYATEERFLTHNGTLSEEDAVAQAVGAMLMIAALAVFGPSELQFTLATLAGLFGMEFKETFAGFDWLLGLSTVALALVFGMICTDLRRWTRLTRFAFAENGREGAFCIALSCFVASLGVAVAMGAHRLVTMMAGETDVAAEQAGTLASSLPAFILIPLAALLFIGTASAFMSIDSFFSVVAAVFCALWGVLVWIGRLLLGLVDFIAELILAVVNTIQGSLQNGLRRVRETVSNARNGFAAKVSHMVRPEAPKNGPKSDGANGHDASESFSQERRSPDQSKGDEPRANP